MDTRITNTLNNYDSIINSTISTDDIMFKEKYYPEFKPMTLSDKFEELDKQIEGLKKENESQKGLIAVLQYTIEEKEKELTYLRKDMIAYLKGLSKEIEELKFEKL